MSRQEIAIEKIASLGYRWDQLTTDMEINGCKMSLPTIKKFMKGEKVSITTLNVFSEYCGFIGGRNMEIKKDVSLNCNVIDYIIKKKSEDFKYFLTTRDLYTRAIWRVYESIVLDEGELSIIENLNNFMTRDNFSTFAYIIDVLRQNWREANDEYVR